MDQRIVLTYTTSADEESKAAKDSVTKTTTIIFKDWTQTDFNIYAAETVKVRQIQPKIRKGDAVGSEYIASRPGTRAVVDIEASYNAEFDSCDEATQLAKVEELQRRMAAKRAGVGR
jgi:hypothetical protein